MFGFIKRLFHKDKEEFDVFNTTYVEKDEENQLFVYRDKLTHDVVFRMRYFTDEQIKKMQGK